LRHVGGYLNARIINEAHAATDTKIVWDDHRSARLAEVPEGPGRDQRLNTVLANLRWQTSLELTREHREVDVWFVVEDPQNVERPPG